MLATDKSQWRGFLEEFNQELIGIDDVREEVGLPGEYDLPEDVVLTEWLGFDGASESDLRSLEEKLGIGLPPSYRSFLATSNGWRITGPGGMRILPTSGVDWLRVVDPGLIAIWEELPPSKPILDEAYFNYNDENTIHFRCEHVPDMLVISDRGQFNVDYPWLNPRAIFPDGEWEAWRFTTDSGHATRYRSFGDLMGDKLRRAKVDRKHN